MLPLILLLPLCLSTNLLKNSFEAKKKADISYFPENTVTLQKDFQTMQDYLLRKFDNIYYGLSIGDRIKIFLAKSKASANILRTFDSLNTFLQSGPFSEHRLRTLFMLLGDRFIENQKLILKEETISLEGYSPFYV